MNGDVSVKKEYSRIYGWFYSEDLRHKYINHLWPLMEENIKENPENVRVFCKKADAYVTSDTEYAAAVVTMYMYDEDTQKIVRKNGADYLCDMVINRANKRRMK